jgi:hypothetical protein
VARRRRIRRGRLALVAAERRAQCLEVAEVELGDPVVGELAAARRRDQRRAFPTLEPGNLGDERAVYRKVVLVEAGRIIGLGVEDHEFHCHAGNVPARTSPAVLS